MTATARLATALGAFLLGACVTLPGRVSDDLRATQPGESDPFGVFVQAMTTIESARQAATPPVRAFDARALPLAPGQIVVSETGDAMSLFFSLFTERYAPWVHAGILTIEGGEPFVYDASGTLFPIPGLPPTATVGGGVRRVALARFARGKRVLGFFAPPPGVDPMRLAEIARGHYLRGTPFDPYFDAGDPAALYCTEFVALALQEAGAALIPRAAMRAHPSLDVVRGWLGIRAAELILAGDLIDSARELAVWSPDLSRVQMVAYFAIKHELHRRFDGRARLGHMFRWSGLTLTLRDSTRAFFAAGLAAAANAAADTSARSRGPDEAEAQAIVRRLADRYFGPAATDEAGLETVPAQRAPSEIMTAHTPVATFAEPGF